jgi:hypothetical protein
MSEYNVILLSHEITKGMKSFGSKCLLPIRINQKTDFLLNHQINSLINNIEQIKKLIIVLGFDFEKIRKKINFPKCTEIVYNEEYSRYGQSYALNLGLNHIDNEYPTLVLSSGIVWKIPIKKTIKNNVVFVTNKNINFRLGCTITDNNVEYVFYNLEPYWAESFIIHPEHLKTFTEITNNNKNMLLFEILNESFDLCKTESYNLKYNSVQNIINMK